MKSREEQIKFREACIAKYKSGELLTLEETAYAIWNPEIEKKPMTSMGIYKIEQRIMQKLRSLLSSRYGIKQFDDVYENSNRIVANIKL
jgi:hypothetical protein